MHTFTDKFNNLIVNLRQKTFGFVYSFFLPLLSSLLVMLFWVANLQVYGLLAVVVITCFVLIVFDDLLPIVSLMFIIPMSFRDTAVAFESELIPCVIIFGFLILSLIFHFIKYPMKKIELDRFFYVILSIIGIFIIGGLFSGNGKHYFDGIGIFLMSGLVPLLIHFFFYNKVKINSSVNIRKYLCLSFIIAISLACTQLCFAYLHVFIYGTVLYKAIPGGFCWANSNHIASLILIAVPLCCYMMLSSKHIWAWFIELVFLYTSVILSGSDGAFATLGVFTPFLMLVVYKNVYKHNLALVRPVFYLLISVAVLVFAYLLLFEGNMLIDFFVSSSNSTGRNLPYKLSIQSFLNYPIFGIGLGGGNAQLESVKDIFVYNGFYHSTFFHILACTGAVGIIGFVIYYLERVKYMLNKDSLLGKFALYAFIMFALYGLIDNNEFNIVLMFMTTLITIVGLINKKGSDDKPLPLWIKNPTFCSLNQSCK
ncbi:MAG: O-antigen ligase family protein [Clostridiales bacterium]|nr:O-antigen ligase family protein [Clostridiales bacterium]